MDRLSLRLLLTLALLLGVAVFAATSTRVIAQDAATQPTADAANAAAEDASPMAFLYGEWRGTASGFAPDRTRFEITQTERVGPMLGGDVTVVEGRGYDDEGNVRFNALGVISFNQQTQSWEMRSYTDGRSGTFPMELTETGYTWSLPAGPNAEVVYTAVVEGDTWTQTGVFTAGEMKQEIFKMDLKRIGDTDWPAEGAVVPQ